MGIYGEFAGLYDRLMFDVNYTAWADYIQGIFSAAGLKPGLVLDLGCGTGNLCIEMAGRGYEMIGIDISADMLSRAKAKAVEQDRDILFLNQDMTAFELYGTVDAILCLLDSINYVTRTEHLTRMLGLVNNYLNPGGLFIFDINSEYKLSTILGSNVFYSIDEDASYIWQNSYNQSKRICTFDLTFFVKEGSLYRRFDETHRERAFEVSEIEKYVEAAGLKIEGIYDGLSLKKYKKTSQRITFVCSKNLKPAAKE